MTGRSQSSARTFPSMKRCCWLQIPADLLYLASEVTVTQMLLFICFAWVTQTLTSYVADELIVIVPSRL